MSVDTNTLLYLHHGSRRLRIWLSYVTLVVCNIRHYSMLQNSMR